MILKKLPRKHYWLMIVMDKGKGEGYSDVAKIPEGRVGGLKDGQTNILGQNLEKQ